MLFYVIILQNARLNCIFEYFNLNIKSTYDVMRFVHKF